ncbi:MAG: lipopolysaccharide biosynthesis protein [Alphaproteobacteria bacterium]|nr:MAG: lipopolysaccharide biosynthesis protein [Alphaproteobacteria bacterium]
MGNTMTSDDSDDAGGGLPIRDLANMLWRGRQTIIVAFCLALTAAVAAVLLIETRYRAEAVLLIESQEIPTSLVAAPDSNYADDRIGKIRQQILSRSNLLTLIRAHKLYPDERSSLSEEQLLTLMRNAVDVDLVTANGGRPGSGATIAFNLSFTYPDAARAFAVTDQLTKMFIDADKRLRTEQAMGATSFLRARADELRDRLVEVEANRRRVQSRYGGAMPDQLAINSQSSAALRAELSRIDMEMQAVLQQNATLAAQAQEPAAVAETPARAEVRRAQQVLDRLAATLSDSHPDVIAARGTLDIARIAARDEPAAPTGLAAINAAIVGGRSRLAALDSQRGKLVAAIARADQLASLSPQAAFELNNVERDHDNLRQQYRDIREKQLEAQVASNLQREDKGEHFSVLDPPTMPIDPISPNRVMILALGVFGGLGAGIALVLGRELLAGRIHGADALTRLTGEPPLAAVPVLYGDSWQPTRLALPAQKREW